MAGVERHGLPDKCDESWTAGFRPLQGGGQAPAKPSVEMSFAYPAHRTSPARRWSLPSALRTTTRRPSMNRHALMIGLSAASLAAATVVGGCSRQDQNQTPTPATDPAASSSTTDQTPTAPDMTTPGNVDTGTGASGTGTTGSTTGAPGTTGSQ